jgi:hypothetical protein
VTLSAGAAEPTAPPPAAAAPAIAPTAAVTSGVAATAAVTSGVERGGSRRLRAGGIATLAAGAALLGGAVATNVLGADARSQAALTDDAARYHQLLDDLHAYRGASAALYAVGAAAAVTGLALLIADRVHRRAKN